MGRLRNRSEMTFEDLIKSQIRKKSMENLNKAHKNVDLNEKRDQSFPDSPLSSEDHSHPYWKGYNDDLFHDLIAHRNLAPEVRGANTSKFIQVGGFAGSPKKTVLKSPLDWKGLKLHHLQEDPDTYSHFLNRNFNTAHREAAFHNIAKHVFAMDNFVPPTTVFRHPKTNIDWSAQSYIDNATPFYREDQLENHQPHDLQKLAIMESILGHNDRNRSNVLFDEGDHMQLIDNALSFDYSHRYGTPHPTYAIGLMDKDVDSRVHQWIDSLSGSELATRLADMGAPSKVVDAAARRLASVKDWSNAVRSNKDYSQDLAGALEVSQAHRIIPMGSEIKPEDLQQASWGRIERGEPYFGPDSENYAETKTAERAK